MNAHARIANPTVQIETITPAMADIYLQANTHNRPVREKRVEELARDMSVGGYQMNGDTIRFDTEGVLLDGQHRLLAIKMSQAPQQMIVIRGLSPETMKTIDSGVKRTIGDRFSLNGHKNSNVLSATLNVMNGLAYGSEKRILTSTEAFSALEIHPGVGASVAMAMTIKTASASYIAALHYIGHQTGYASEADDFLEVFKSGYAERPTDPALVARERLIVMRKASRALTRSEQLEVLTAAWENKRKGNDISKVRVRTGDTRLRVHGWDAEAMWGGSLV